MKPSEAGQQLERSLGTPKGPLTIADAAAKSGLALRDAERGMHWLTERYRGHLRVTDEGDLLFTFPTGFTRPWIVPSAAGNAVQAVGRGARKIAQYAVRAWITIVMLLYVLVFVALIVALVVGSMAASGDRRDSKSSSGMTDLLGGLLRFVAELFIWTRPYPYYGMYGGYGYADYDTRPSRRSRGRDRDRDDGAPHVPFHERVNNWVFGPPLPPDDPRAREQAILAAIRAGKGRIGLADVMRVTGLPRDQVDAMMARLMLDYEGDVDVSDEGGIAYRFESLRKTASNERVEAPLPSFSQPMPSRPLIGNPAGKNALVVLLNVFNLGMGAFALVNHITIASIFSLVKGVPLEALPQDATAIVLGIVPMIASLAILFAPLLRAPFKPIERAKALAENGRRAVTRAVLDRVRAKQPVRAEDLSRAWQGATGSAPDEKTLTRVVVSLGGDVDLEEQSRTGEPAERVRYRFEDLELEARAVEEERAQAREGEAKVGRVVFASDE